MADGMSQLLASARDAGDLKAYTYVDEGNIPSLRGCANVGFEPDHLMSRRQAFWHPQDPSRHFDASSRAALGGGRRDADTGRLTWKTHRSSGGS